MIWFTISATARCAMALRPVHCQCRGKAGLAETLARLETAGSGQRQASQTDGLRRGQEKLLLVGKAGSGGSRKQEARIFAPRSPLLARVRCERRPCVLHSSPPHAHP